MTSQTTTINEDVKIVIFNAIMNNDKVAIHSLQTSGIDFRLYCPTIVNGLKGNPSVYFLKYFIKQKCDITPYKKQLLILAVKQDNVSFAKALLKNSLDVKILRQLYTESQFPSKKTLTLLEALEKKFLYQQLTKDTKKSEASYEPKHKI